MEISSYIFRAGRRALYLIMLMLALFVTFDAYCTTGKGPEAGLVADTAAAWYYIIDASDGRGGNISPEGKILVWANGSRTFEMIPNDGKEVKDVKVDGESVGAVYSYTFSNVNSNHTIRVEFQDERFTITATAGTGGSISPSGAVEVKSGDNEDFDIKADGGYDILDVIVDGVSQGAIKDYKFSKVKEDHTIHATFIPEEFTITASAGRGGSITPSGEIEVKRGDDEAFSIRPDNGYDISDVLVDGESEGSITRYEFTEVVKNHTIEARFNLAVEILNVSIPNESMKIGDQVTVTIEVTDDDGDPYSFVSGTVGGYNLEGFQRLSATTYQSSFTITQGGNSYSAAQDIPVSELVIKKGSTLSSRYDTSIRQEGDPIDAALPVVRSMEVPGDVFKVGDVIELSISADGSGYDLDPNSSMNGIAVTESNMAFYESGGGDYLLRYTVREGDTEVGPGASELQASITLIKPSGNVGQAYSTVNNASQLIIDAHPPVVILTEVPSLEVGVGGRVVLTITADEAGYLAEDQCKVNGVALSSPRVTFTELSAGLYEMTYQVELEDPPVAAGELQVYIVMTDMAGNLSDPYEIINPNSLEIYTDLPEAAFGETPPICEGEEAELNILLSGRAPWSFDVDDGTNTTSYTNITSSNYRMTVTPEQTTTYQISLLKDVNGVENTNVGNTQVTVNVRPEVEILNLANGYNVEADPVLLEANIPGGTFSGPGVVSATGYFYPTLADTIDSPHEILYTYANSNGCMSVTSQLVYVLGAKGAVLIPDNTVCLNDLPFTVSVMNVPQADGSFSLLNSNSQEIEGLTDHGDNSASIDPALLASDHYTIEYQYFDQVTLYLRTSFSVESAEEAQILNLTEDTYCQNTDPITLQSNLANVVFEGPGISGDPLEGYTFSPREADPGMVSITCISYSENGCTASSDRSIGVLFTPEVKFELSTECIPEGGEQVSFENQTKGKSYIESWSWNFGDEGSGEANWSDLPAPTHQYQIPGEKSISLSATTFEGCVSNAVLETIIDSKPVADFTWISDCFTEGSVMSFVNQSIHGSAIVDTVIWTFKNSDGSILGEVGSKSASDTIEYPFEEARDYMVDLYTRTTGGCYNEITKEVSVSPTIRLSHEGYHESFDQAEGLWSIQSENQLESWSWGEPDFTGYSPTGVEKAWFTQFPEGTTSYTENSWIQSPCFDFTEMERPMISLDLMRSFAPGKGGAVLQFKDPENGGWQTVGEHTPGIGWYNVENLINRPGGSSKAWGLNEFTPDIAWKTAVHDLDRIAGKSNITFRIAIATEGKKEMGNQGFAINNVGFTERSKLSVLEHFTSSVHDTSRMADDAVDLLAKMRKKDLIDLQYHMDLGGMDPMNQNNPLSSSTRSFNYAVPVVPYTVLDGGAISNHRYDFLELTNEPVPDHLRVATLEMPAFEIELSVDWRESSLEAHTRIVCSTDQYDNFVQLYLVVIETTVSAYTGQNGDVEFRNVVVDMLPSPAGSLLGGNWREGGSEESIQTWNYKPYIEDIHELAVVAFIQDRSSGQILQAAVNYKDKTVGSPLPSSELKELRVYPNPAQNFIFVNMGSATKNSGRIELLDVNGKLVVQKHIPAGYQIFQMAIDQIDQGIYILRWSESGQTKGLSKVVKFK